MKKELKILILLAIVITFFVGIINIIPTAFAVINIDSTYRYAWNDVIGWIDFYFDDVHLVGDRLKGYASSSVGYIAFDCQSSPNGNICSTSDFAVENDGSGNLSGWAWNDVIGWISFDSATASSSYVYQVSVSPSTGDFSGWAWNDVIGWISFNCLDTNSCATSDYKVKSSTEWTGEALTGNLTSSIFDTQVTAGVAINTIMWQGDKPSGTNVRFQIASNLNLGGEGGTGPIDSTYRYAWNDYIGWIDFGYPAGNVNVGENQLTGYAYNDDVLQIALDCATTPIGNICSQSDFKVSRNPSTGELSGYAWNDYIGWISFNCSDPGLCASSDYRVNTAMTATWDYIGPDGSDTTYYTPNDAGIPVQINLAHHNNKRYFRYKMFLESDAGQTASPRVDDVIINWSP